MSTSTSHPDPGFIFDSAIQAYKKKTGNDITTHPLATELQSCHSLDAVLAILRNQASAIGQSHGGHDSENLSNWLIPTVNVLHAFSATLGEGVGPVNIINPPLVKKMCPNICLSGILTCKSDFCGNLYSLPGQNFSIPHRSPFSCRSFSRR